MWFAALLMLCADGSPDRQIEFTSPTPLLSADGSLSAWGWARRALMIYNREAIPAERQGRIKEWEHYTIMSPDVTVGVTIVQLGSLVAGSAEVIDYREESQKSGMSMIFHPKERSFFPSDPHGSTEFRRDKNSVVFQVSGDVRKIGFNLQGSANAPALTGTLQLDSPIDEESIAITRPFSNQGEFFYENKIFGMPAKGNVSVGEKEYSLPEGKSFAIFDWGRGIWPRNSQWFWGQAAGNADGKRIAINLGHGYGDDAKGTANALLVDGKLEKLHRVDCEFDPADRMKPWTFKSDDGRLQLTFKPIYHQQSVQNIGLAAAELHKIHGHYSGKIVIGGKEVDIDNLLGFAEHMKQRW